MRSLMSCSAISMIARGLTQAKNPCLTVSNETLPALLGLCDTGICLILIPDPLARRRISRSTTPQVEAGCTLSKTLLRYSLKEESTSLNPPQNIIHDNVL